MQARDGSDSFQWMRWDARFVCRMTPGAFQPGQYITANRSQKAPGAGLSDSWPFNTFKHEVEYHLAAKEIESWEVIHFKLYKSQLPAVNDTLPCKPINGTVQEVGDLSNQEAYETTISQAVVGIVLSSQIPSSPP